MKSRPLPFIVLIERRVLHRLFVLLSLATLLLAGMFAGRNAYAQSSTEKVALDLRNVIAAPTTPKLNWAKDVNGIRYVKALVVSNSTDPDLTSLRSAVMSAGGSVYMRYLSVAALSVMVPANQVMTLAARADVQTISPNRLTARTGISLTPSLLEMASGVPAVRTRTESNSYYYTGLDGRGIGIAVLDSGVMWKHKLMMDWQSQTRVKRAIDFLKVGDATAVGAKDWTPGIDATLTMVPGGSARTTFESTLDNTTALYVDAYGHGTHVAAVAAGRDYNSGGYTEATGIAPGANIYDVKVLDGKGFGQLSDVLAGIDWVIYHAKEYNIRVMNLSLAADSTENRDRGQPLQTGPLPHHPACGSAPGGSSA